MDYPPRNTDSAEKIWIGRECGFRARETVAADEVYRGGLAVSKQRKETAIYSSLPTDLLQVLEG